MKMRAEHYEQMKTAIVAMLTKRAAIKTDGDVAELLSAYRREIVAEGKAKNVDMRVRWDIARLSGLSSRWMCDTLYSYIDDTHIDTALRRIMRKAA